MKDLKIKDTLKQIKGKILCGDTNKNIEKVCKDTRELEKGDTYIALKGENVDGVIFCKEAIEKGARICIVEKNIFTEEELKEYSNKTTIIQVEDTKECLLELAKIKRNLYDIPVIAITGSVGKTSTKDVIAAVMSEKYKVYKTQGNKNNRLGVPLTILELKDHEALVIEIGMNHLGEISELTKIVKPTMCVISNIGTAHIGNLGSRENILKAKLEILEGMDNGKVIINNDNDLLNKWEKADNKTEKITFGITEKSNYNAKNIAVKENGNEFTVEIKNKEYKFTTKKSGEPFILNALSAIAVGIEYNIPIEKIQEAIAKVELTKNRMDIEKINNITIIKDYYNASFESMKPSIEYLAQIEGNKKIAILGDIKEVGKFAKELHEKVGKEVAKNKIDILITVGKDSKYIANSALKEGMPKEQIYECNTNKEAVQILKNIATEGDRILMKASNGMKFWEIYENYIKKIKVAVIVGGMSSEHDISLKSGKSILKNINKNKYETKIIYIDKDSQVYQYIGDIADLENISKDKLQKEINLMDAIKESDIVFPVLHGRYGEDGSIQGMLEMMNKKYVGCGILASSACIDKEYTKKLVSIEGIKTAKTVVVRKNKEKYICNFKENCTIEEIIKEAEKELKYPMFVKPAKEGSSFGVNKAENIMELEKAIKEAEKYDSKILIEEAIQGREVECAVLGNTEIKVSEVGEVKSAETFYSFDAKYNNEESKTIIPAQISEESRNKIRENAKIAFKAVDGKGLARVDFFLKENGEVILNEINTMPGFTNISMYPKLFEAQGLKYSTLIDKLIELGLE